jgi:catechol 2,3-dioxygenase-like lactoylglutathione lyase family enzyme
VTEVRPRLGHVGFTVSDLDASIAFYRDIVGMRVAARLETGGPWFDELTRNHDAAIGVAMLELGEMTLQLVAYRRAGGEPAQVAHHRPGSPHLSIEVDDVDARYAAITATGRHHPTAIVDILGAGIRSFYVKDPDGIPVEFLQMPSGPVHQRHA